MQYVNFGNLRGPSARSSVYKMYENNKRYRTRKLCRTKQTPKLLRERERERGKRIDVFCCVGKSPAENRIPDTKHYRPLIYLYLLHTSPPFVSPLCKKKKGKYRREKKVNFFPVWLHVTKKRLGVTSC